MVWYNDKVWFGTREFAQWVPAPAVDIDASKTGYASTLAFLNGGARVRRSKGAAKSYNMSWNLKRRADIQPILDYADGMYGNGAIYYVDPFAADMNMLPTYWAAPYVNYYDGPVIVDGVRPTLVSSPTSVNGYPVESVIYKLNSTSRVPSIYLPIPPGYTAYVGAHGSVASGSASVRVIPELNSQSSATPVNLTLLPTDTQTRTNASFSGNQYAGITLTMASASTGTLQLSGMIVELLPDGAVPSTGGFVSGQGTSGLSFASQPSVTQHSAAMDKVAVSAELIETEAWSW